MNGWANIFPRIGFVLLVVFIFVFVLASPMPDRKA